MVCFLQRVLPHTVLADLAHGDAVVLVVCGDLTVNEGAGVLVRVELLVELVGSSHTNTG